MTNDSEVSKYLAGKRTMDWRDRNTRRDRKYLGIACAVLLFVCAILAAENLRNSAHSRLIPYVVQTDQQGRIVNTEILRDRALGENFTAEKTIKAELTSWVQDWRTVTSDVYAQKALAVHVFDLVDGSSEASNWLLGWYKKHDPVERGKREHVDVTVRSIVPQSENTYEVYWDERAVNPSDSSQSISRWRGVFLVAISPPKNEAEVIKNRFGLYIQRVNDPQREKTSDHE